MLAEPCTTRHPDAVIGCIDRCRASPEVGIVMQHPTGCIVIFFCRLTTGLRQLFDHLEHRFMCRRKVEQLRRPVVHLSVDICRVFTAPWWYQQVVPDALQIGGPGAGSG